MQRASPVFTSEPLRVAGRREIDVQFGARTARAGIAHHPEIVLLVAVDDVNRGIEPGFANISRPMIVRFLVELARLASARVCKRSRRAAAAEASRRSTTSSHAHSIASFLK